MPVGLLLDDRRDCSSRRYRLENRQLGRLGRVNVDLVGRRILREGRRRILQSPSASQRDARLQKEMARYRQIMRHVCTKKESANSQLKLACDTNKSRHEPGVIAFLNPQGEPRFLNRIRRTSSILTERIPGFSGIDGILARLNASEDLSERLLGGLLCRSQLLRGLGRRAAHIY